jgi:hypothetical protein
VRAKDNGLVRSVIHEHGENGVLIVYGFGGGCGEVRARGDEGFGAGAGAVPDSELMAGGEQAVGHWRAHFAEAEKGDFHDGFSPGNKLADSATVGKCGVFER